MSQPPRRRRPRKPLTAERVIDAALTIADEEGVTSLSMRKVAKALGVEAMSLYHHVAGKEAILDGIVDAVFAEIPLPAIGDPWREAMEARAKAMRETLHRHPWAVGLLDSRANPGPNTLSHHNTVVGCLREAGFTIAEAAHAFSLMDAYIYGFVLQEQSMPFPDGAELEEMAEEFLDQMRGAYPYLTEMLTDHVLQPGYDYGQEFTIGLEVVLGGIEARRAVKKATTSQTGRSSKADPKRKRPSKKTRPKPS